MLILTFEIKLKSNYHIGAGYGKGFNLDSALLREAGGRAIIRGTTVAGLLRDSARRLLKLPVMVKYVNSQEEIIGWLFGEATQAKHWRIDSAYSVGEGNEDSQVVQRVRIDLVTRRAEPQKLFSQEEGLAGQVFRFAVTCPDHGTSILDEAAFLVAAARNIRQMGSSRRRGLGECVIYVTAVEGIDDSEKSVDESWESFFLKRFNEIWLRNKPTLSIKRAIQSNISFVNKTAEEESVRIRVIIRLDEPMIVTKNGSAGNQFETNMFIPGSVLLGALATKAAGRCNLACPEVYQDFVTLFRRNGVIFPMLYLAHHYNDNLYPTIPAPLGLLTCSLKPFISAYNLGHGLFSARAIKANNSDGRCLECQNKLEPLSNQFLVLKPDMAGYIPRQTMEMHIKINDETQRVNKGNLFGYTVLEAGQYFTGDLVCANENVWRKLQEMSEIAEKMPLVLYLGKARQRGYGRVTMWLERINADDRQLTWIQKPLEERVSDPMKEICLTFLTDTIIVDKWGRQADGLQRDWLESTLNLGKLDVKDAYAQTRIIDSFNATLGLPRWRELALTGGSTAWVQLREPPLDWEARMRKLEAEGIGRRRNEGFGCIAFNHPVYEHYEEIDNSVIYLDQQMKLSKQTPDVFIKQWEKKLDDSFLQVENWDDSKFMALGYWLHNNSGKAPEELKNELEKFSNSAKDDQFIDAVGGPDEYGQQSKTPFFKNRQQVKETIDNLLDRLQEKDRIYWRPGIVHLAERITMLFKKRGDR
jgi:CRISPR-associated protein Csx10